MQSTEKSSPETQVVGSVVGLWRYPVKSMAAEPLETVEVSWFGLAGDRRWAFVRDDVPQSGFPWFTLRQRGDLNQYRPTFADPTRPDESATVVQTPDGRSMDVTDPALAEALAESKARVIRQSRGVFDTFPVSLITTQTIREIGVRVGTPLQIERFRPNILVDLISDLPFEEDSWVGRTIQIGAYRMRVDKRDGRCVVITIDPATGERLPQVLRTVAEERDGCLGVYGTTVEPGAIAMRDDVILTPS